MRPVHLAPNQPRKFYRGGAAIAAFRRLDEGVNVQQGPEDWVGSTVTGFGSSEGLSRLPGGRLLRDAIAADPRGYLGPAHVDAYGDDPSLLVKLLDAGERLPVHCHPNREFAQKHLDSRHGKTEAWIVIGTVGSSPTVYLGFTADVEQAELDSWLAGQDSESLLGHLNAIQVRPGDTVLVPGGTPHAIGEGVFVVELQEPTDFSVILEWKRFGRPDIADGQLGLPADLAMRCLDRTAWLPARRDGCVTRAAASRGLPGSASGTVRLLPEAADPFFRAEEIIPGDAARLDPSFALLVVLEGEGHLETEKGDTVDLQAGGTVLVPYDAGATTISGSCRIVRCLPPLPRS